MQGLFAWHEGQDVTDSMQGRYWDCDIGAEADTASLVRLGGLERAYLDQVVEDAQAVRVLALLHLHERAQLGGGEGDVSLPQNDLQLLPPCFVRWRPVGVILLQDL